MSKYYINKIAKSDGCHELHTDECKYLPSKGNRVYLGNHSAYIDAVKEARKYYTESNGCFFCSNLAYT
jgi:hypothetical protein